MALRVLVTALLLAFAGIAPSMAQAAIKHQLNISQQALGSALAELARQAKIQVIYSTELVEGLQAPEVKGHMTPEEALRNILPQSGLGFEFVDRDTITLVQLGSKKSVAAQQEVSRAGSEVTHDERHQVSTVASAPKSFWQRLRLAQAEQDQKPAEASAGDSENNDETLEEIVVTAQKRQERLKDVPVPVSAINAQALADNNQVLLRDYLPTIPSTNLAPGGQGVQTIAIRGITTGTGNPTVAVLVDGVAYNPATNIAGGRVIPDFDPGDLARIELLRGPQGTLFGAASLGGLLNFVTRDPSTQGFEGSIQAGVSSVRNGKDPGYSLRGSANLPVSDALAVRVSAFSRLDPGFIDDPSLGRQALNDAEGHGGRFSALWAPSDVFSLKLGAMTQKIASDGSSTADLGLGDLEQQRVRDTGTYDRQSQFYSAIAKVKFADIAAVSTTSYAVNGIDAYEASTLIRASFTAIEGKKFSQELQFNIPLGGRVEWLLGGFYTSEDATLDFITYDAIAATGERTATTGVQFVPTTLRELAGFTDLTVRLTERFDIQAGVRRGEIEQSSATFNFGVEDPALNLKVDTSATTYLFTPRYRMSDNLMVYARMASGYRIGGPNAFAGGVVPPAFEPDKTENYEMGAKGTFLNEQLTLDASIFYIDWKGVQFNLLNPANDRTYTANGSDAKSQGVELSAQLKPMRGLTIGGWITFDEAELSENFPPTATAIGLSGDRLPYSARHSGRLSVRQEFPLWSDMNGFVSGAFNYIGDRVGPFRAAVQRQAYPSYSQIDLNAGLMSDHWSLNIFATNVGDERGQLNGGLGVPSPNQFHYITPRTIGMSVTRSF
jgi:iron complex outermembrane recepter protein